MAILNNARMKDSRYNSRMAGKEKRDDVLIGCPLLAGLPPVTSAAAADRCYKDRTNGIVLPVVSSEKVILPGSGFKL